MMSCFLSDGAALVDVCPFEPCAFEQAVHQTCLSRDFQTWDTDESCGAAEHDQLFLTAL